MILRAFRALFILFFILSITSFASDTSFLRLTPTVVQSRLEQLNVVAEQRPAALKKAFQEAGCPASQITEQTVKEHIKHIMRKTNATTRTGILVQIFNS